MHAGSLRRTFCFFSKLDSFILLKLNIPSVKLSLNFIINSNLKLLFFAANKIFSNISSFETIKALGLQSLITYEKSLTEYVV